MTLKKETKQCLAHNKLSKLNKFISAMLLCISLCFVAPAVAHAEEGDGNILITSGCTYNAANGRYYYEVSGVSAQAISATIVNDGYTNEAVSVSAVSGFDFIVYKDGAEYTDFSEDRLTEPGEYAILAFDNRGQKVVVFRFTILAKAANINRIDFPGTCTVVNAKLNGEQYPYNRGFVTLTSEGDYEIDYVVSANDKEQRIHITIDTVAPTLKFKGLNDKNEAHGPVSISEIEEDAKVTILRNGNPYDFTEKILDSGNYRVTVQDVAGNQTAYEFVIVPYYNFSSWVLIGIVLLIAAGCVAYVVFLRKNFRVR